MKTQTITATKKEVIDIHCHAAGIGAGQSGCSIAPALRRSWKYRIYLSAFGVSERELNEHGDILVIKRLSALLAQSTRVNSAVVLAMDGVVGSDGECDLGRSELYIPNEFVASAVKECSNLYFGAGINPYRKDAVERLERAIEDDAVLVKWLPSIQNIDPADRRLIPFYTALRERGVPLLTHTGSEHSFTRADNGLADPERLRLPLELGVTVIAAHAGATGWSSGVKNFKKMQPLFKEHPNLYADISSLTQMNKIGHLQALLRHEEVHGRLLYGTDMPLPETGIVSPFAFLPGIGLKKSLSIQSIKNPWDKDVELKEALGVPASMFEGAGRLLSGRILKNANKSNNKHIVKEDQDLGYIVGER